MSIPDYQTLMLPVLEAAGDEEVRTGIVVERIARTLGLTEVERNELLPSGRQTTFSNRVHWAKTYLTKAGLLESTRRGHFKITERGRQALAAKPSRIDNKYLSQYEDFQEFRRRVPGSDGEDNTVPLLATDDV